MGSKIAFFFALAFAAGVCAQQPDSAVRPPAKAAPDRVYFDESSATPPEPIEDTRKFSSFHLCGKKDGMPVLVAIVGKDGVPSQVSVVRSAGKDLDEVATAYVAEQRFTPGTLDGVPVAVAIEAGLDLEICTHRASEGDGQQDKTSVIVKRPVLTMVVMPAPLPDQGKSGGSASPAPAPNGANRAKVEVIPPVATHFAEAEYTLTARQNKVEGICKIMIFVDSSGRPQNPRIVKSLEPSLDQSAIRAVMQYRFKPATKNGQPVPFPLTVEVDFRLY